MAPQGEAEIDRLQPAHAAAGGKTDHGGGARSRAIGGRQSNTVPEPRPRQREIAWVVAYGAG